MKKGYTLAEVLITLGVIGIIVAIMLPLINKTRPLSEKTMYLKTYDSIVSTVHFLANNKNFYPITDDRNFDYSEYPLANTSEGSFADQKISGKDKLKEAISLAFNLNGDDTTPNGIVFEKIETKIETETYNADGYSSTYSTAITFTVPNSKTKFNVNVYPDGRVVPIDNVGAGYISTRTNWFKRKDANNTQVNDSDKEFSIKCAAGYTFDPSKNKCTSEGEVEGEPEPKTCSPAEQSNCAVALNTDTCDCSCTNMQKQAKIKQCAAENKQAPSTPCGVCGGCLAGYTMKNGICTKTQSKNTLYNWQATGYVMYRCQTSDSISCYQYRNPIWTEQRPFEMQIMAYLNDTEESKKQKVINNIQRNLSKYVNDNEDNALTDVPSSCGCFTKSYISVGNINFVLLGEAIQNSNNQ